MIRDLRPVVNSEADQCDMVLEELPSRQMWTKDYLKYRSRKAQKAGRTTAQCLKSAKYEINGRKLCAFHAGIAAIDILLEAERADK